jgi:hypothetical protein
VHFNNYQTSLKCRSYSLLKNNCYLIVAMHITDKIFKKVCFSFIYLISVEYEQQTDTWVNWVDSSLLSKRLLTKEKGEKD